MREDFQSFLIQFLKKITNSIFFSWKKQKTKKRKKKEKKTVFILFTTKNKIINLFINKNLTINEISICCFPPNHYCFNKNHEADSTTKQINYKKISSFLKKELKKKVKR